MHLRFWSICRLLTTALLISLPAAAAAQIVTVPFGKKPPPAKISPLEREILDAGNAWVDAVTRGDLVALRQLETADFLMIQETKQGVAIVTRGKEKKTSQPSSAQRPKVERTLDRVRIRQYGDVVVLTAVATYRSRSGSGRVESNQAVISEIWVKQDGAWRLSHFQPTKIPIAVTPKK
jgi:ketosteroid isomerase-like protein